MAQGFSFLMVGFAGCKAKPGKCGARVELYVGTILQKHGPSH